MRNDLKVNEAPGIRARQMTQHKHELNPQHGYTPCLSLDAETASKFVRLAGRQSVSIGRSFRMQRKDATRASYSARLLLLGTSPTA